MGDVALRREQKIQARRLWENTASEEALLTTSVTGRGRAPPPKYTTPLDFLLYENV